MTFPQPFDEQSATETDAATPGVFDEGDVLYEDQVTPEYGILGFTLRELIIVGLWLVAFVVSFFPVGFSTTLWSQGISWILPIGVPTAAVFLIVLRRFSPDGIRRVGSLGVDQFASVAFSVAAVWWAQLIWEYVGSAVATGVALGVWVPWVEAVLMLALVAAAVFAFLIPGLREDFHGRLETLAHRNANPVRPVIPRPSAPKPGPVATAAYEGEPADGLDVELSGENHTDEIARIDVSGQVPLTAHASGGDIGAVAAVTEDEYVPAYARRSRRGADSQDDQAGDEADDAPIAAALGFDFAADDDDDRTEDAESATASADAEAFAAPVEYFDPAAPEAETLIEGVEKPHDLEKAAPLDDVEDVSTRAVDIDATNPRPAPAAQPFWALAPTERDVFDEQGEPIFRIGPTAWALVIEDRGGAFVVRHDDGRIGYLHDIADITKG